MRKKYYILISLMMLLSLMHERSFAQDSITVYGVIRGTQNQALEGISVSVEGMGMAPAVTDDNGAFRLSSPSGNVWLNITPPGDYQPKRIYLNKRTYVEIHLSSLGLISGYEKTINLYGPETRRNIISGFEAPVADAGRFFPYESVDQFYQGSVSGVYSIAHSGMPGLGNMSFLRGIKSMNTNSQPLYIIDGMPTEHPGLYESVIDGFSYHPLSNVEPMDISNITIMKDYLGSSAYGMQGSNGIVLIETMKPTEVRTTIDFAYRTGLNMEPRQIPVLNSEQYKTYANEVLLSSWMPEETHSERYPGLFLVPGDEGYNRYAHSTNWQDEIFTNGIMNDVYLGVKGGDEIARYGLSVGFLDHKGIIKNTGYKSYNIRFVGTFNIFSWLRMYISSSLNTSTSELKESAMEEQTGPIFCALAKSPLLYPYQMHESGEVLISLDDVEELGVSNPTAIINNFEATNRTYRFTNSFRFEGDILPSLKWRSIVGLNMSTLGESVFMPNHGMESYYDGDAYNVIKSSKDKLNSFYNDNNLTFSHVLRGGHSLLIEGGFRLHKNKYGSDWGLTKDAHENDEYKQLQSGTSYHREIGGTSMDWNRMAFYANAGYTFRDRYILFSNLTAEASSLTGPNAEGVTRINHAPFGTFYSMGAAWRISSEPFFRDLFFLEELKLRISYGIAGNDDLDVDQLYNNYKLTYYRETSGMVPGNISDGKLKFENYGMFNAGLDLSLLAERFSIHIDHYRGKSSDMLISKPLSESTGHEAVQINNGSISNNGIEFRVFARIYDSRDFSWDITANVSGFRNRVEDIYQGEIITSFTGGEFISRKGEKVLNFYGLIYEGVYPDSESASEDNFVNKGGLGFGAGDAKFKDVSGPDKQPDGVIDEYDKTIIGSPIPEHFGGLSTRFRYKRWSLQADLQYVYGNEVFNYVRFRNESMSDLNNQSSNVLNRWYYEGHITDVPRASWGDPMGNAAFSSRWIEDGSYLRLKNLILAYSIPEKFLVFRNAEVYITASNLITYTRYLGYDPEFSYSVNTMEQGIDYGLMPQCRKFMLGIKLGL